jgi:ferric-dicitrate binding protein FerR (iron transport regulator)
MKGFNRKRDLATRLRTERPQPSSEFLASVEDRVRSGRQRSRGRRFQLAFAGGLTAALVAALASVGGVGYAASGVTAVANVATDLVSGSTQQSSNTNVSNSSADFQYGHKFLVCHNGVTIFIDQSALNAHLRQGDTLGPCP